MKEFFQLNLKVLQPTFNLLPLATHMNLNGKTFPDENTNIKILFSSTIIGESNSFTVYPSTTFTQKYTYCALQRLVDLYRYVGVWEKCLRLYCNSKGYCTKKWLIKCSMGSTSMIKRQLTASISVTNSKAGNEFALFSSNTG